MYTHKKEVYIKGTLINKSGKGYTYRCGANNKKGMCMCTHAPRSASQDAHMGRRMCVSVSSRPGHSRSPSWVRVLKGPPAHSRIDVLLSPQRRLDPRVKHHIGEALCVLDQYTDTPFSRQTHMSIHTGPGTSTPTQATIDIHTLCLERNIDT